MADAKKGLFITFEGSEGTGKTTQIQRLTSKLEGLGRNVTVSREPGGTALGEEIRHLLKHAVSGKNMVPRTELLLFAASRAQHVDELILPNLKAGNVVICDRFHDSTTVYQGIARAIDGAIVESINQIAIASTLPDITILIDLDPEEGFRRILTRKTETPDRMEQEHLDFYKAVRRGYLDLAENNRDRFLVIDGHQTIDAVEQAIWDGIKNRIK
ncbi:MAG: dTMP kinase [Verrucomicrobia bacterium]|nr:dTMP kinase [Verrucomicrobiota bacterium]MDA1066954.1 dTMP kinase [Verrucomicrobiota bacterium]